MAAALVVVAGLAAYANSFSGPFVFDDLAAIGDENPTIRHLWKLGDVLSPPSDAGQTVGGRPLANLTLAINYAIGGAEPFGYHVFNLAVHLAAALVLLAWLGRTLRRPVVPAALRESALPVATVIAVLWTVHPLQTESVTYVVQRVESLAGLFLLLTLYGLVRSADAARPTRWLVMSVAACLCGMATKEVMAVAPVLALLYDRTFLAGSFREAWRRRGRFHLALAATWLLLAWLVFGAGGRGGTAGFDPGSTWLPYLATQMWAIVRYVRLALWPDAQVFDYGPHFVSDTVTIALCAAAVVVLLGATVYALWRAPVPGFVGAWFFGILAPSALIPVPVQTVAEHRMYLPLLAVLALIVGVVHLTGGRRLLAAWGVIAVLLLAVTLRRNADYRSELLLWSDVVQKWPGNARAHASAGTAHAQRENWPEAIAAYRAAIDLEQRASQHQTHTNLGVIHANLGNALREAGRTEEALPHFVEALRLEPGVAVVRANYGFALLEAGGADEAMRQFREALRLQPGHARAHEGVADALVQAGRFDEAVQHYEAARRSTPASPELLNNLASAYFELGRLPDAIARYEEALRLDPTSAQTHCNLGNVFAVSGRTGEAIACYERALRLDPHHQQAAHNLSWLRGATTGR